MDYAKLIIGLIFLTGGAHFLVEGSKNLALKLNIRPIIVGLTIVAMATSFPELLVSLTSALKGSDGMAVGNIVGSNIANIALVLAIAALVRPFKVKKQTLKVDFPVLLGTTILFCCFVLDKELNWVEGITLLIILVGYIFYCIKTSAHKPDFQNEKPHGSKLKNLIFILAGSAVVIAGACFLVAGGVEIARNYNISKAVIGLTVFAVGTSLPELAATVTAAVKDQNEIGMGNIIGSNIFNFALVIGIVPIVLKLKNNTVLRFELINIDIVVMVACVGILYLIILKTGKFGRIAGMFFLLGYLMYVTYCYKPEIF
ncbi:MAG: sodium:calcium antiporter [Chlamydiae bacterium]|nr:MAG: sodium:calcium antiporter [Chlamydiota bacterium]